MFAEQQSCSQSLWNYNLYWVKDTYGHLWILTEHAKCQLKLKKLVKLYTNKRYKTPIPTAAPLSIFIGMKAYLNHKIL